MDKGLSIVHKIVFDATHHNPYSSEPPVVNEVSNHILYILEKIIVFFYRWFYDIMWGFSLILTL